MIFILPSFRLQLKKMSETKKEEKKKLADEDAARRIKQLEDQTETLRKQVANQKQEEETLLSDIAGPGVPSTTPEEQREDLDRAKIMYKSTVAVGTHLALDKTPLVIF